MKKIRSFKGDEKKLFRNLLQASFFLNTFMICSALIYQLGFQNLYYGSFVGICFLIVFYFDLALVGINNHVLNKGDIWGKRLNWLSFLFLVFAILSALTLMGISAFVGGDANPGVNLNYFFYALFLFALGLTYLNYRGFTKANGMYIWDATEAKRKPTSKKKTLFLKILKGILFGLAVTTYIFTGIWAFCIITLGGPPIYGQLFNLFIAPFFSIIILQIPLVMVLVYKITYRKYRKVCKVMIITGLILTVIAFLPLVSIPFEIPEADRQFEEVFGEGWNEFDPEVSAYFSQLQYSLIQTWFGDASVDPDAWELDSDNVFVETDDYKLYYDVYYPGKTASKDIGQHSTIIFIHGGAWVLGDKSLGAERLGWLASQGYVCFSIEYRLLNLSSDIVTEEAGWSVPFLSGMDTSGITPERRLGEYTLEDMLIDIGNFTQYLAKHEGEKELYGADLDHIFFMGQSAGAHLSGVAGFGYNDELDDPRWGFNDSLGIDGIVLFYPPNSARRFFYEDHRWFYEAGFTKDKTPKDDPEFFDLYTPSELVDEEDPKCIIFQGTADSMVPPKNAQEIDEACMDADVDCILIEGHFVGHAHDINTLHYTISNYYLERFLYLINSN